MSAYDEQRKQGAQKIAARAKAIAIESNISIIKCEWDNDQEISDIAVHKLVLGSDQNSIEVEFSDEQLADYPGKAGTERTDSTIREAVRHLIVKKLVGCSDGRTRSGMYDFA